MIKTPSSTVIGGAGIWTPNCTVIGAQNNINQFIKSLFADGGQGAYLDNNDLSTVYQDSLGTIAGAVGQSEGLILDKSKELSLGAEKKSSGLVKLVGTTPVATYDTSSGIGTVNRVDFSNQSYLVLTGLGTGLQKITIRNTGTVDIAIRAGDGSSLTIVHSIQSGNAKTFYAYPANGSLSITSSGGSASFTVDSIKEIAGNHAQQNTSSKRPILRQGLKSKYAQFDAIDDALQFNNPALSNVTIIKASASGVNVLKNQSIVANHTITQDFSQYLMINKALSDAEISRITAEFNKYV